MREVAESWPQAVERAAQAGGAVLHSAGREGRLGSRERTAPRPPVPTPACATGRFAAPRLAARSRGSDGHVRIWWRAADRRGSRRGRERCSHEADDTIWRKLWAVFGREPLTDERRELLPRRRRQARHLPGQPRRAAGQRRARRSPIRAPAPARRAYIVFNAGGSAADPLGAGARAHPRVPVRVPGGVVLELGQLRRGGGHVGRPVRLPARRPGARVRLVHEGAEHAARRRLLRRMGVPLRARAALRPRRDAEDLRAGRDSARPCTRSTSGVPGGLAKAYPEFAKLAWNHDPVKPSFWEWDGFDPVPEDAHGAEIVPEQVDPGAAGQQRGGPDTTAQAALTRVQAPEVRRRTSPR